jgi:hypothetical protein
MPTVVNSETEKRRGIDDSWRIKDEIAKRQKLYKLNNLVEWKK